jgi:predicted  nucleic acid-binding Zn-ribbon protein
MTEAELLELKKEITEASGKAAELKGQRTVLSKQLKEKWGVTTPKEGKAKLDSMQADIDKKDAEIKEKTEELEAQLNEHNTGSAE